MRRCLLAFLLSAAMLGSAVAQESDKKTDDLKPADPDTGESTVEESTLGLLPNPFEKKGVKFAITYIGEALGNPTGGQKQSAVYEDRINFAVDVDFQKLVGLEESRLPCQRLPDRRRRPLARRPPELHDRQRHRGAAEHAALRNLVRAEMGRQVRAARRPACGRHRVHDLQIYRCLHQCLARLARGPLAQHAERRAVAAAWPRWERGCAPMSPTISACSAPSSTAMPPGPGPTIRNCAIAMASISASTIRRWSSARFSFCGTARRAIRALPENSRSAAGGISGISPMSA